MIEKDRENMSELLADQAIFGLNSDEERELERLSELYPDEAGDESFEIAAAAFHLALMPENEAMPAQLENRIIENARIFFGSEASKADILEFQPKKRRMSSAAESGTRQNGFGESVAANTGSPQSFSFRNLGWLVAAAACIALAVNVWQTRTAPPVPTDPGIARSMPPEVLPSPKVLTAAEERQKLMAEAADAVRVEWKEPKPDKAQGISGDVVWSNASQKGYVVFRGLPVNDKTKETYQLWIVDTAQGEKTPISGGVFNVDQNGELIIPIDAAIKVTNPKMFAVTAEKPGGVVVSKQDHLMAIAKI